MLAGPAVPLASVTGSITSAIGNHGLEAIFLLMLVGAVLPIGSELVMIYGGAVASGAIAGGRATSSLGRRGRVWTTRYSVSASSPAA